MGQERNTDVEIHARIDHNDFTNILQNTEKNCVVPAVQRKASGMLVFCAVFLHDNTRPHTVSHTCALLECFNWELFDRLPYRPDLAPSDYHMFVYLKNWLRSQHFDSNEEFMEGVKTWLSLQLAHFFNTGIQKLIARYSKCHNSGGDYVEK
jgi:hypothetical protein